MFAHAVTLALSSLSLVFVFPMLFGLRGAVAWTYMENERNTVTTKYSVGLQEIESFSSQNEGASTLIQFGGDACKNSLKDSTCNSCKEAGGATFAFTFFAMLFLVALLATQYARYCSILTSATRTWFGWCCAYPASWAELKSFTLETTGSQSQLLSLDLVSASFLRGLSGRVDATKLWR